MSDMHQPALGPYGDARIIEEVHIRGPCGEDDIEAIDDRGRRWYHLRPDPRRRADLMGLTPVGGCCCG